jgi:hypothetical protein
MACLQPADIHHYSRWWGYRKPILQCDTLKWLHLFFVQFAEELATLLKNSQIE